VVVTDGVFEGDPAEGVRYPSARRPDLARFLALPFGFRFTGADAWLDPEVADRPVRG